MRGRTRQTREIDAARAVRGRAGTLDISPAAFGKGMHWVNWLTGDSALAVLLRVLLTVYCLVLVWAWVFSDRVAFQPPPPTYNAGEGIQLIGPERHRIAVYCLENPAASRLVLYAHGNGEDLGDLRGMVAEYRDHGFDVCAFDYEGYGISDGRPSTANAYRDINTVYKYLVNGKGIDPNRIILHGRSLGAAVALHLATRRPVSGIIVESAFLTEFRSVTQIPLFPFDKMRNDCEIKKLSYPVLFIHGEDDRTIRIWQGKELYRLARALKFAYWVPGAGHDDLMAVAGAGYWKRIRAFADLLNREKYTL